MSSLFDLYKALVTDSIYEPVFIEITEGPYAGSIVYVDDIEIPNILVLNIRELISSSNYKGKWNDRKKIILIDKKSKHKFNILENYTGSTLYVYKKPYVKAIVVAKDSLGNQLNKNDLVAFYNTTTTKKGLNFGKIKKVTNKGSIIINSIYDKQHCVQNQYLKYVLKLNEEYKKQVIVKKLKMI